MQIFVNGARGAGNHAISNYLKILGLRKCPGLFESGLYWRKLAGTSKSDESYKSWRPYLAGLEPDQYAAGHSAWHPDLIGFTLIMVRRDPQEIAISLYRRRCREKHKIPTRSGFHRFVLRRYFYEKTVFVDAWDDVPGVHYFDFATMFEETQRRRLARLVNRPFVAVNHFATGHSYTGKLSTIDQHPFRQWWSEPLVQSFWDRWNGYRNQQLARTRRALVAYGIREGGNHDTTREALAPSPGFAVGG